MRICNACRESKPESGFGKPRPSGNMRPRTQCRACENARERRLRKGGKFAIYLRKYRAAHRDYRRRWNLKAKYHLANEEYETLFRQQDGLCAICRGKQERVHRDGSQWLEVDHDHVTGRVRGLLCHNCNLGLGRMRDDPQILRAAAQYLAESIYLVEDIGT